MGAKREIFVITLLILILGPLTSAATFDRVITNSENWMDVYSGIHYATLSEAEANFLTSTNHGPVLLQGIQKEENIRVISSKDEPYVFNYPDLILSEGFSSADEIEAKNLNIELIKDLDEINNFIIIGDIYGYNAIAVVPYAVQSKSWVFFANEINIGEIDSILSKRNIDKFMIYGYVDRTVRDTLEKYSPEVISSGDRFEDNVDITKKFLSIKNTKQVSLSNGDFLEMELMKGANPILFTGRENVPEKISEYLKTSPIEIGVLIGNELMGAATNIRHSTGISVMVKFARGARTRAEGIAAVEGLDLFPLPAPLLELELYSLEYNTLSRQLEATYKSSSNIPAYFKGTITVNSDSGKTKVGDEEAIFISPNSHKTILYPLTLDSYEDLTAQIFTIFGESISSLDRAISINAEIGTIDVIDRCEIELEAAVYNKQTKQFNVEVKNLADVDCWAEAIINNLKVGYEEKTVSSNQAILIKSHDSKKIIINEELIDEDLDKNNFVDVVVYFGEKETNLVNVAKGRFELTIQTFTTTTYTIIVLFAAMILSTAIFIKKRKKELSNDFL